MEDIFQQIKRLQLEIGDRKVVVSEIEAEVRELERELEDFTLRYDKVVHALNRLEAVKKAIGDLEQERRLKAIGTPATSSRHRAWKAPAGYVPVEEQLRRRQQQAAMPRSDSQADSPAQSPTQVADKIDLEAELKRLYRKLARKYHPDLAKDADDAKQRTEMMAMVNDAYARQDLETLISLQDDSDMQQADTPLAVMRLRQLQQINRELARKLTNLKQEQFDLLHNSLMDLKIEEKLASAQGRDLLGEIIKRTDNEYWTCMAQLDALQKDN